MKMRSKTFQAPGGATLSFSELGFGAAPIGNLYAAMPNEQAEATLDAAWADGIRYYDTAPLYGLGLSETRLNRFLRGKPRGDYLISTKVGRLMRVCPPEQRTRIGAFFDVPSRSEEFDYTYDGVMRSLEFSLERLGLDQIDILLVHDLDVFTHGSPEVRDGHIATLMNKSNGGYKALTSLRDQKLVKAIGAGVNETAACELLLAQGEFDLFLLAGRYTLLEQAALETFLPLCQKRGVGVIGAGIFNSGILASGAKPGAWYNYSPAPQDVLDRVAGLEKVCASHDVKLVEAALRFPLMHPSIVTAIPGASSPEQIALNSRTLAASIPAALWSDLKAKSFVRQDAPITT